MVGCFLSNCHYQFESDVTIILKLCHYQYSMDDKNICNNPCPISRSLTFAGDAWSLLILRDAHAGLTRFDQFRKSIGIAPTILTRRLTMLTEEGLLEKRLYSEHPPREEYLLTAAGRDFLPVLFMIGAWGRQYRGGGKLVRFLMQIQGRKLRRWPWMKLPGPRSGLARYGSVTPDER